MHYTTYFCVSRTEKSIFLVFTFKYYLKYKSQSEEKSLVSGLAIIKNRELFPIATRGSSGAPSGRQSKDTPEPCSCLCFVRGTRWRHSWTDGGLYREYNMSRTSLPYPVIACSMSGHTAPMRCGAGENGRTCPIVLCAKGPMKLPHLSHYPLYRQFFDAVPQTKRVPRSKALCHVPNDALGGCDVIWVQIAPHDNPVLVTCC